MASGGASNSFAVEASTSPLFSAYWSTYEDLHSLILGTSWVMPPSLWNKVPFGKSIYWRVRGADLDVAPLDIITSDEVWSFTKE
jgi:hypothetical protein